MCMLETPLWTRIIEFDTFLGILLFDPLERLRKNPSAAGKPHAATVDTEQGFGNRTISVFVGEPVS